MEQKTLYTLKSPYRESLDVEGFTFGEGEKSVAIVGSTRGNEVQQMYVCSILVKKLKELEKAGKIAPKKQILVVPCINSYSMNIGKRFWTMDNTDINRMFPGYDLGETTQRIAAGVFEQLKGYEYGIQMASFYQEGSFIPHVKNMRTGFTDRNLMKKFGLPYGIVREPRPYDTTTLNYNWQIWETKAFSVYTSETDNIDEESARTAVLAILRFLANVGIISHKIRCGYATEIVEEAGISQVRTKAGGIFENKVKTGEFVEAGTVLGEIKNPLDNETMEQIVAEDTGIVFFRFNKPLINENMVCYKIIKD